jgi:hypothetical protein
MRIHSVVIKKLNFSLQMTFYKNGKERMEYEVHTKHKELYMSLLCSVLFNVETIKKTFHHFTYRSSVFCLREGYTNIAVTLLYLLLTYMLGRLNSFFPFMEAVGFSGMPVDILCQTVRR